MNANGANNGRPFVTYTNALAPSQSGDLIIIYSTTNRVAPVDVVLSARVIPTPSTLPVGPAPMITRAIRGPDGHLQLEFTADPGKTYAIQHSTDLRTWADSGPVIVAPGRVVPWVDTSLFLSEGSTPGTNRYYRAVRR